MGLTTLLSLDQAMNLATLSLDQVMNLATLSLNHAMGCQWSCQMTEESGNHL